jgi:MOSC domain-containing protein YiiM
MRCETWITSSTLSDVVLHAAVIVPLVTTTVVVLLMMLHKRAPLELRIFGHLVIALRENKFPRVLSVSRSPLHKFSKDPVERIRLIEGLGVEGDAHSGKTVQHLSRVRQDPSQPNLRQVHLLQGELLRELGLQPCDIGENITTEGIDLLGLGRGTRLRFSGENYREHAVVEITGLRNPCPQIESFQRGLQEKFIVRNEERQIVGRKAGVMGVVVRGGEVRKGMKMVVKRAEKYEALDCV